MIQAALLGDSQTMGTIAREIKRMGMTPDEAVRWANGVKYGLAASVLPVWLLLAPRDYLSTFLKLGTVAALAVALLLKPEATAMA